MKLQKEKKQKQMKNKFGADLKICKIDSLTEDIVKANKSNTKEDEIIINYAYSYHPEYLEDYHSSEKKDKKTIKSIKCKE